MSNKIPVMRTVSRTYGFLLGEIGTIIRLTWAPFAIAAGFTFLYGQELMTAMIAAQNDPTAMAALMPKQFLLGLVSFLAQIMATVALLRVVLSGDRKPGLFVYLWFGAAEMRLVLVTILLAIAALAGMIGVVLVLALLGALAAAIPGGAALIGIGTLVGVIALFWAILRLSLISPVVVAENNLGVERSWQLMAGNALRMLFVFILTFLPYLVLAAIAGYVIIGNDFPPFPKIPGMEGADATAAKPTPEMFQKAIETWQLDLTAAMAKHWPEFAAVGVVGNVISTALTAGATGNAYNAVTDRQPEVASTFS